MENTIWSNIFSGKSRTQSREALALKHVPVFENLNNYELEQVKRLVHHRSYQPDEYVFRRNAPGEGMYIILKGNVEILDQNENSLAILEEGDFFGDLSLLDKEPRSAHAIARDHSELLGFFRPDLETLIKRKPDLAVKIILNLAGVIGERLRKTNELLAEASS